MISNEEYIKVMKNRRTIYNLGKNINISDDQLVDFVKEVTNQSPTAFNSQPTRVVVALNENHDKVWDIVLKNVLKSMEGAPESAKDNTKAKIASFKAAHATILYFTDTDITKTLMENFDLYADKFEGWADQAQGGLQQAVWTGLANLGLGASLQHYNPLIDEDIKELFNIPANWTLLAQMPVGSKEAPADEKEYMDPAERFRVFD